MNERQPMETRRAIQSKCPTCEKELILSESQIGQTIKCPYAGCPSAFTVKLKDGQPDVEASGVESADGEN